MIISRCANGKFRLKDCYSHCLKTSFHPSKLVRFYEDKMYKLNEKGQVDHEVDVFDEVDIDMSLVKSSQNEISSDCKDDDVGDNYSTACERVRQYNPSPKSGPVTSKPIKSQIVIMSSQEMPPSSDESETIDVCLATVNNPFSDMNVNEIPIEIVDDLNDDSNVEVTVTGVEEPPVCIFKPVSDDDCVAAALNFSLVINAKSHPVQNFGIGEEISSPPNITLGAQGNGACLFNSSSLLLSGCETYSAIIRHVIYNYISNPVKHNFLSAYLPTSYKTGKEYVTNKNIWSFTTWGTEVEIIAFAQLTGFDVKVYTAHKQWAMFCHDPLKGESSKSC